jgi:hypothetical protein
VSADTLWTGLVASVGQRVVTVETDCGSLRVGDAVEIRRDRRVDAVTDRLAPRGVNSLIEDDGYLYDRYGRPVVRITNIEIERRPIDVTSFGDVERQFVESGHVDVTVRGVLASGRK